MSAPHDQSTQGWSKVHPNDRSPVDQHRNKELHQLNNSPFHNFTADSYNHNQTINDQTSQNHFFPYYITGNQSPKCTLLHPCEVYSYEGTFFFRGPCARITQKSPCWNPNQFSRIPEPGSRLTGWCASQPEAKQRIPANQLGLHVNNTRIFLHNPGPYLTNKLEMK